MGFLSTKQGVPWSVTRIHRWNGHRQQTLTFTDTPKPQPLTRPVLKLDSGAGGVSSSPAVDPTSTIHTHKTQLLQYSYRQEQHTLRLTLKEVLIVCEIEEGCRKVPSIPIKPRKVAGLKITQNCANDKVQAGGTPHDTVTNLLRQRKVTP